MRRVPQEVRSREDLDPEVAAAALKPASPLGGVLERWNRLNPKPFVDMTSIRGKPAVTVGLKWTF